MFPPVGFWRPAMAPLVKCGEPIQKKKQARKVRKFVGLPDVIGSRYRFAHTSDERTRRRRPETGGAFFVPLWTIGPPIERDAGEAGREPFPPELSRGTRRGRVRVVRAEPVQFFSVPNGLGPAKKSLHIS